MPDPDPAKVKGETMTFEEAVNGLDREERFKATVATMNTLLIQKGIYTKEEYEAYFIETAKARIVKELKRTKPQ